MVRRRQLLAGSPTRTCLRHVARVGKALMAVGMCNPRLFTQSKTKVDLVVEPAHCRDHDAHLAAYDAGSSGGDSKSK